MVNERLKDLMTEKIQSGDFLICFFFVGQVRVDCSLNLSSISIIEIKENPA